MAALGALDAVCLILLRACLKTTWFEVCILTPETGSSQTGISDLLVAHQLTGSIRWRVMQADSVLTFTSASSLVEFVCEFLKYKCAAAIWFCAKHAHTHPPSRKAA